MARIYRLSRTALRLLYKVRHHKGHGIHSPFVFNLINKVVEEKNPYHAYEDIKTHLNSVEGKRQPLKKENKLAFRLVNYFGARNILEIGSGMGVNTICITAPSKDIVCTSIELDERKSNYAKSLYADWNRNITLNTDSLPQIETKQDCIFIDLKNYKLTDTEFQQISNLLHDGSFIVVKGIRTNKRHQLLWKNITDIESRTAVLDLFNIGIVFFDKKLYRWSYQISF